MNQVMLVGRIVHEPQKIENNKAIITLAINRNFKNKDGMYDTDFIQCVVLGAPLVNTTLEYCFKGDVVGVKGRLENLSDAAQMTVVAEKITFLGTKQNS